MTTRIFAVLCGLALAAGCTETVSPDHAPPDVDDGDSSALSAEPRHARASNVTDVALDAAVADLCAMRSTFALDPNHDDKVAEDSLQALASCVTAGPLQGRSLELVAHTSARRDSADARRRGESRAEALRALLIENGVPATEIRGGAAVAGDEQSVEVRIAPRHDH